ncbi:hypothetical protein GCK32_009127 [Trichostrongylus colubriformis]|uniref:Uncharacterized protein n=1 Tax=Trichostrongylus colubriformis TaxID=6319 RepID=A0AAN8FDP2_TRICO
MFGHTGRNLPIYHSLIWFNCTVLSAAPFKREPIQWTVSSADLRNGAKFHGDSIFVTMLSCFSLFIDKYSSKMCTFSC